MLCRALAFFKRDLLIALSYRLQFIAQLAGILVSTMLFFFVGQLVDQGQARQLEPYGGDYFAFVLIGVAFADYLFVSINSFADEIRKGQMLGTIEAMLVTPLSSTGILMYSSLYNFAFTSLRVLLYLAMGSILFGLELRLNDLFAFALILGLTIVSFWGIGLVSAAFVLVFKQSSPLNWLLTSASGLFGGVMFPIEVLPGWLKPVSALLPITYSLEAMRQVLLNGAAFSAIQREVVCLGLFAVVLMGAGLAAFAYGLVIARKQGSLLHY